MKSKRKTGFTVVELLVTVAIIVVLAGISIPLVQRGVARSRQASCLSQLRNIGLALESYLQDNNRRMPDLAPSRSSKTDDAKVLETELASYLSNRDAFHCPADGKEYKATGCSYIWNSTLNGQIAGNLTFMGEDGKQQRIPLVADKEAWHPGPKSTNILYADYTSSSDLRFVTGSAATP